MLILFVGTLLFLPFMLGTLRAFTLEIFDKIVAMG
jgi:flagellar biosynthesis protein FliQ